MFGTARARLQAEVFSELATMFKAGVTIGESLTAIGEDMEHSQMAGVLTEMGNRVSSGESLTKAMRGRPDIFSPVTISMVEVGETGGRLEQALRAAGEYHERDFELRHLLTRESAYPVVLFAAIIFIMPLADFIRTWITDDLPAALVGLLLKLALMLIFIGVPIGALLFALRRYSHTEQGRQTLDAVKLNVPIVGKVIRKLSLARFCRALASLYSSGVLLGASVRLAGQAAGNAYVERELTKNVSRVESGGRLSEALRESPLIPRMVVRMLRSGEDSGEIDEMARHVAEHFEEEARTSMKQMVVSITPIAVIIAGVIVAIMLLGAYGGYASGLGL